MNRLFKEPLLQFLLFGALLYVLVAYVQTKRYNESREIIVENELVNLIIVNYKTQTGNLPTKQQLDAMINNYIKEEISYREAKKMGLDKADEIIRRRLSQKFDFLQTDLKEVATPSEEVLAQFYKNNPALFQKEATVSFSHIYFSTDKSTDPIAKQRALVVLQQLQHTSLQHAPEKGDRFALQYDYTGQALIDVQQNFGDKPMANELFKAPLKIWVGPFQSGYGWHLLYVSKIDSTTQIPFASIKAEVKTQYLATEKAKHNKLFYDQLSKKYIINRAYLQTK